MITKEYRFKSWDGLIQIVLKQGQVARSGNFSMRYLPTSHPYATSRIKSLQTKRPILNKDLKLNTRFGVVVSKKVSKSAVTRNRIRRRVYEWIRLNLDRIEPENLILIFAHTDAIAKLKYPELSDQLEQLFVKAGIVKKSSNET